MLREMPLEEVRSYVSDLHAGNSLQPNDLFLLHKHGAAGGGFIAVAEHIGNQYLTGMRPFVRGKGRKYLRKTTVYYPHPDDSATFALSIPHLPVGALARAFPGSVGVLHSWIFPASKTYQAYAVIRFIHGSFLKGRPKELDSRLVRKYKSWRLHLLDNFFRDAASHGIRQVCLLVSAPEDERGRREVLGKGNAADFIKVARRLRFEVTTDPLSTEHHKVLVASMA